MFRVFFALILVALLSACAATSTTPATQPRPVDLPIETVETAILESLPIQLQVRFTGMLPDGCTTLGEVTSERDDDAKTITITAVGNHSGAEACTMQIEYFDQAMTFEGPFAAGEWTVIVNGVETKVTL